MDPIAKTAYYCCGIRAADAKTAKPICGDRFASRFMNAEANAIFELFRHFRNPNASNLVRHRLIDDWIRERLQVDPDLLIVLLGAGFDTRAYRLTGGRWLEIDQPATIAIKEMVMPATEAPNSLVRIPLDFALDSLADKLALWRGKNRAVVILEGVSMYLEQPQLRATLQTLNQLFLGHTLICDLMNAHFVRRYGGPLIHCIEELGGRFAAPVTNPAASVVAAGYRQVAEVSIVECARELGALSTPPWFLNTFLRGLRDGYRVYIFEAKKGA